MQARIYIGERSLFCCKKVSLDRAACGGGTSRSPSAASAIYVIQRLYWPEAVGTHGNHLSAHDASPNLGQYVRGRVFNANLTAFVNICCLRFIDFALFLTHAKACKTTMEFLA